MPRNGDGSGDNGPIDGHEILHGTSGDTTLQHTKHVAPMPKPEAGEALPGMNASGGAAAPLNDASEEYGASAPRKEKSGDDETSTSGTSGSGNSQNNQQSSGGGKSSHSTHGKNELEEVSHEKAQRYTNLNEQDVQHAGAPDKNNSEAERSKQRAPKDAGPKEDIEQLHGKATLAGNDKADERKSGKGEQHENKKSGSGQSSGKGGAEHEDHELESSMRHQAEKFVNLDD